MDNLNAHTRFPRVEDSKSRLKVRGEIFKTRRRGNLFYSESSPYLESADKLGDRSQYDYNF